MGLIEWTEEMSVGIEEFDTHHKRIVSIINHLDVLLETRDNRDQIETILAELSNYCLYHFFAEEDAMTRFNYKMYAEHKKEHLIFTEKIFQFLEDMHSGKEDISRNLLAFLWAWLKNHILVTDKQYSADLRAGGIS
ncbi:MAG TPA: bacteriohemerythrin [Dissulfurispiraceae bacterium]|nr:bacteriohemerythrin [Dissulfurispiraceae bacterium]